MNVENELKDCNNFGKHEPFKGDILSFFVILLSFSVIQCLAKVFTPLNFSTFCHVLTTNGNVFYGILCDRPTQSGA